MSPGMLKMWISFASMGLMILSILTIYLSRYKIKMKPVKFIIAFFAYIFLILSGLLMVYVVFSSPNS
ncbi:DUF2768 domain-containing protein [Falsibacillus pallidus]|uniref:Uncharacterized protein DUF2768 n=1 Tax=Falsibacillus pallidus TaxID=493781 RepID=A0A370GGS0_9BACI|nr:DUF2768 domain-containing protein [Falsibacillus pallidus]RDI42982.1 uncharacterized protein DUF2768 [Falsibacillus pallidus]